jgi:diketogulonate reductase-like aldo/keto reductase
LLALRVGGQLSTQAYSAPERRHRVHPGTRHPERIDSNVAAVDVRLSTEDSRRIDELDSAGLAASGEALL